MIRKIRACLHIDGEDYLIRRKREQSWSYVPEEVGAERSNTQIRGEATWLRAAGETVERLVGYVRYMCVYVCVGESVDNLSRLLPFPQKERVALNQA